MGFANIMMNNMAFNNWFLPTTYMNAQSVNPFCFYTPIFNNTSGNYFLSNLLNNINLTQLKMPIFNWLNINPTLNYKPMIFNSTPSYGKIDTFTRTVKPSTSTSSVPLLQTTAPKMNNNAVKNLSWWKAQGYNEEKGKQLAANTKRHSDDLYRRGIKGECGQGVRKGIQDTFYNGATVWKSFGQARLTGDKYLSKVPHLKKINVEGMNLSKNDIPAGAIVIYDAGYSRSSKSYCGHIEVSGGNGHGYSDLTTTLLQNRGAKKVPKEIWIPV